MDESPVAETDLPSLRQQIAQALLTAPKGALVDREWLRAELPGGEPVPLPLAHKLRRKSVGQDGSSGGSNVGRTLRTRLQEFERAGWIERVGNKVRVLDPEMLAEVAAGRIVHVHRLAPQDPADPVSG